MSIASMLNDLSQECGENSKSKGFHSDWEFADHLEELARANNQEYGTSDVSNDLFTAAEIIRRNHLGMKLMLIVSECSEALETLREHGASGILNGEGNFPEELADADIRLMDLAMMIKANLGDEVVTKMEKNSKRPYMHGKHA